MSYSSRTDIPFETLLGNAKRANDMAGVYEQWEHSHDLTLWRCDTCFLLHPDVVRSGRGSCPNPGCTNSIVGNVFGLQSELGLLNHNEKIENCTRDARLARIIRTAGLKHVAVRRDPAIRKAFHLMLKRVWSKLETETYRSPDQTLLSFS